MHFRTLEPGETEALLELLDGWKLGDGWRGRDFFRRYLEDDPTFAPGNVWVAEDDGRLISCVQIFPRKLRLWGNAVPGGGIGTVFTRREHRRSGVATALLDKAVQSMRERGMEVSLLFAVRLGFYRRQGWRPWPAEYTVLRRKETRGGQTVEGDWKIASIDPERDLAAVMELCDAYSARRQGSVARDPALWEASLRCAGNPDEEFLVARDDSGLLAYIRATVLEGVLTITEWGRTNEATPALAHLSARILTPREGDPLARRNRSSNKLRSRALMPPLHDPELLAELEHLGFATRARENRGAMLRCLDPEALSHRLRVPLRSDEEPEEFLARVLPPERFAFWPADRF